MGIHQLLPLLKPAMKEVSLSEFRGKRVGVDGNVWVHRGAFSCSVDLATGTETDAYVRYCTNLAQMMIQHGVRPLVVFDGKSLRAKDGTTTKRRAGRNQASGDMAQHNDSLREMRLELESRPGDTQLLYEIGAAQQRMERCAQSAISVTQPMVEKVMAALHSMGVEVLRSPYEADAQLAFLARHRKVDAVLTEDSDLVAYACPCVLLKLDRHTGQCQRINWDDVRSVKAGDGLSLASFTDTMFLELCILMGCDYLESVKGVGLKVCARAT